MIAAGLCMMGGCFAQDENGSATETYWHAHSVKAKDLVLFSTPFLMVSCFKNEFKCFGYIENARNIDDRQSGQCLFWGAWDGNPFNTFFLGVKNGALASLQRWSGYEIKINYPCSEPVPWESFTYRNKKMNLCGPDFHESIDCSDMEGFDVATWFWYPRITPKYSDSDMCAYAYYAAESESRFCIQPMRSISGDTAFYDVDNAELIEQ